MEKRNCAALRLNRNNRMGGAEEWGDFGGFWLVKFFGWPGSHNSLLFPLVPP